MNPISVIGAFVMTFSFLAYGIGSVTVERFRIVGSVVLIFMSVGIVFETAAFLMVYLGANELISGLRGLVGASAFLIMLANVVWVWLVYFKKGIDAPVSTALLHYTKTAYFVWVLAYLAGIVILILK